MLDTLTYVKESLDYNFLEIRRYFRSSLLDPSFGVEETTAIQAFNWTNLVTKEPHLLAAGGCGDLYKGVWNDWPSQLGVTPVVVVKDIRIIQSDLKDERKIKKKRRRLLREVEVWGRTRHPNVLPFIGVAYFEGRLMSLIFLYMENGCVTSYIKRNPAVRRTDILLGVTAGLAFLHDLSPVAIIHGDMKAENVLVDSRGNPRLSDFGLSKLKGQASTHSASHAGAPGTVRWMSPELLDGRQMSVSTEGDVWAYAMTCLEIMTGRIPFHDISAPGAVVAAVILRKHLPEPPPLELVPSELWKIWISCWSHEPHHRPSMQELRLALATFAASTDFDSSIPISNHIHDADSPSPEPESVPSPPTLHPLSFTSLVGQVQDTLPAPGKDENIIHDTSASCQGLPAPLSTLSPSSHTLPDLYLPKIVGSDIREKRLETPSRDGYDEDYYDEMASESSSHVETLSPSTAFRTLYSNQIHPLPRSGTYRKALLRRTVSHSQLDQRNDDPLTATLFTQMPDLHKISIESVSSQDSSLRPSRGRSRASSKSSEPYSPPQSRRHSPRSGSQRKWSKEMAETKLGPLEAIQAISREYDQQLMKEEEDYDDGGREMTKQQYAAFDTSSQILGSSSSLIGLENKLSPPRKLGPASVKHSHSARKPTSAFFLFFNSLSDNGDASGKVFEGETSYAKQLHKASSVWRDMTDSEKTPYRIQARASRFDLEASEKMRRDNFIHASGVNSLSTQPQTPSNLRRSGFDGMDIDFAEANPFVAQQPLEPFRGTGGRPRSHSDSVSILQHRST